MKTFIIFVFVLFSMSAQARNLYCEVKINGKVVAKGNFEIQSQQKILLTSVQSARFYITQKPRDYFSMEAFLPAFDARVYGEGYLRKAGDRVAVALWSRDSLIEALCAQLN